MFAAHAASQVRIAAENGMAVSVQYLAKVGTDVLKDGGNAVEAAAAAGYALAMCGRSASSH